MKFRTLALALLTLGVLFPWSDSASARDDPEIKGKLCTDIQGTVIRSIDKGTIGGAYRHFDPVTGELLKLELVGLQGRVVKKGDFYVTCADFEDHRGRLVDLDFLVMPEGGKLRVTQAVVHKLAGEERAVSIGEDFIPWWEDIDICHLED